MTDPQSILTETTLSLSQAARRLPPSRNGAAVSLGCILRWVLSGARGPGGEMVRLEAVRLGGRWLTSLEALSRFAERLTPHLGADRPVSHRTPRRRDKARAKAADELERAGI